MEKAEQSSFCKLSFQLPLDSFLLDIHFSSNKKRIGILGASGSGKSMCLKSIAGIVTPKQGEILLGDSCLFSSSKKINLPPQKRRIGYLFQSYALFPHLTVWENIAIAMQGKENKESRSERIFDLLRKMELSGLEKRFPGELSGGQQQRVALARIFANEPKMILLDEPSMGLSPIYVNEIFSLIQMIHDSGVTVLLVEQNANKALMIADRAYVLETGVISLEGEAKALLADPKVREAYLSE